MFYDWEISCWRVGDGAVIAEELAAALRTDENGMVPPLPPRRGSRQLNDDPDALADALAAAAVLGAALARFENALDRLRGPLTAFAAVAGRGADDEEHEDQHGDQGQQDQFRVD